MNQIHIGGFPRIGAQRELKFALEGFWKGDKTADEVAQTGTDIRARNWALQQQAGLDWVAVGDFSYYDHVLDTLVLVGGLPERFSFAAETLTLEQYSALARGNSAEPAMEMTKWFDTNYHYLVPEWQEKMNFQANAAPLLAQIREAREQGYSVKPTLLGPLSLLWLGKTKGQEFDKLSLLPHLTAVYAQLLQALAGAGIAWVQIDEPVLALDLPQEWLSAFADVYRSLGQVSVNLLLAGYFGSLAPHAKLLADLPVQGIHVDAVRAPEDVAVFAKTLPAGKILSVGIIDGRNVWRADLSALLATLAPTAQDLGARLWLAPSCSLLHCPQNLEDETALDDEIRSWLAFAVQKLDELAALKQALAGHKPEAVFAAADAAAQSRRSSTRIHRPDVTARLQRLPENADKRASRFAARHACQAEHLRLPLLPTTTIGSFPQTPEIRQKRAAFKAGRLNEADYTEAMRAEIAQVIREQETLGLDVLVHGEAERNDMVEYFGEELAGFAFTRFGWVQSYGSRCVKPPIIYGDVAREHPMTVAWASYAQSLTTLPVKGMLTGPVTMLQWSFVRNDLPRATVCRQIALALNDEVLDLEKAGIRIIQIDEPAFREGLPLKKADWAAYLAWAAQCFRLTCADVADRTQIHTHMCYSEFHDILEAIAAMDADVITIETSRSDMELLDAFARFDYPNDIGPGVYDIHSPRIPPQDEIEALLNKALQVIPKERLWVNPDCGLKTRTWPQAREALANMVAVTKTLRTRLAEAQA